MSDSLSWSSYLSSIQSNSKQVTALIRMSALNNTEIFINLFLIQYAQIININRQYKMIRRNYIEQREIIQPYSSLKKRSQSVSEQYKQKSAFKSALGQTDKGLHSALREIKNTNQNESKVTDIFNTQKKGYSYLSQQAGPSQRKYSKYSSELDCFDFKEKMYQKQNALRRPYCYDNEPMLKLDYNKIQIKPIEKTENKEIIQPKPFLNPRYQDYKAQQRKTSIQANNFKEELPLPKKYEQDLSFESQIDEKYESLWSKNKYEIDQSPKFHKNCQKQPQKSYKNERISLKKEPYFENQQSFKDLSIKKENNSFEYRYENLNRTKNDGFKNNFQSLRITTPVITPKKETDNHSKDDALYSGRFANYSKDDAVTKNRNETVNKLKMISEFNDKINERIKSIIECFQGLKSKY